MKRAVIIVLFFAALVGVWWLATASGRWSAVMLPSPLYIGEYLWNGLWDGSILEATLVTMQRLLVGYFIGVALGGCGQKGPLYLPTEPAAANRATLPELLLPRSNGNDASGGTGAAPAPAPADATGTSAPKNEGKK